MGRPELPLDPTSGPVAAFAWDLRALREVAGTPAYRTLSRRTHFSVTTLSQAAAGRVPPSLPVLRAFVAACGGDSAAWESRWHVLMKEIDAERAQNQLGAGKVSDSSRFDPDCPVDAALADAEPDLVDDVDEPGPAAPVRAWRRRYRVRAAVVGLAAVVTVGALVTGFDYGHGSTAPRLAGVVGSATHRAPGAVDPVADGSDPNRAGCGPDAVTLAVTNVHFPAAELAGELELRYSPRCRAAWSRFQPAASWTPGPGVVVTVWTIRPADQATQQYSVPYGGETIIGNMLMTAPGCIAAEVTMVQSSVTSPVATTLCQIIDPTGGRSG